MIRRVDFHVHDGLEQRGARLFHTFFEGERAGDFESHVGGIDVVIFAVVKTRAEIDYRKSGEEAALG